MNLENSGIDLTIYPPYYVPFWRTTTFVNIVTLVAIVGISLGCLWVYKRFFRLQKKSWQVALEQLRLLEKQLENVSDSTPLYADLTGTLRTYFSVRYAAQVGKTDNELLEFLAAQSCPAPVIEELQLVLTDAMYVKFAQHVLDKERMHAAIKKSMCIVEQTVPIESSTLNS